MSAKGHHTTLWRENDADPAVFEKVADVLDLGEQSSSMAMVDDTRYDDSTSRERKTAGGLITEGDQEFIIRYEKGNTLVEAMLADYQSGKERRYQLRFKDAEKTCDTMTSVISSTGKTFPKGDLINRKITLTHNLVEPGNWV
ncbi:MAG: hypothetical protein OIF55_14675 [Amphritea sp.]|nr:hypothetical protein [Amphritea sp.]